MKATAYTGWLRTVPDGRWEPVCSAFTEKGCWDLLLPIRDGGPAVEKLVLPSGKHPERRRKPR